MGYGSVEAQYLTIPGTLSMFMRLIIVYLWGAITNFTVAWWSDCLRKRGIFLALSSFITILGYIVLLATANAHKPGVLHFATYLIATGLYIGPGLNITYHSRNLSISENANMAKMDGLVRMWLHIINNPRQLDFNKLW
jgi:hypothetical protein